MTVIRFVETSIYGGVGARHALPLAEFRQLLVHRTAAEKDALGAWSPADYKADCTRRLAVNVVGSSNSIWLDLDGVPLETWARVLTWLEVHEAEAWTTHSWGKAEKPGMQARIRLTVDREHTSASEVSMARLGLMQLLLVETGARGDEKTSNPDRIFYCPAVSPDRLGTERVWKFNGESRLSVDSLIARGKTAKDIRSEKRNALILAGKINPAQQATASGKLAAEALFQRLFDEIVIPVERKGRKSDLYALGGRLRAYAEAGAVSLQTWMDKIRSGLKKYHPHDWDTQLWYNFENGLNNATQFYYESEEDTALLDEAVAEEVADLKETKALVRFKEALAWALPPTVDSLPELEKQLYEHTDAAFADLSPGRQVVVQINAGAGKTTALAKSAGKHALTLLDAKAGRSERTPVLFPSHAVAGEFLDRVDENAKHLVEHRFSPLVAIKGKTLCMLTGTKLQEAREDVFERNRPLMHRCLRCEHKDECHPRPEFQEWKARDKHKTIEVATHQNPSVVESALSDGRAVIVDEMPHRLDAATVTPADIALVRPLVKQYSSNPDYYPGAAQLWSSWIAFLEGRRAMPSRPIERIDDSTGPQREAAVRVSKFTRLALSPRSRATRGSAGWEVSAENHLAHLLGHGKYTIFSATPAAIDGATVHRVWLDKYPNHTRVGFVWANAGRRKIDVVDGALSDPDLVEWAVARVAKEAAARGGRGLLVTFKNVADHLRAAGESRVELAYFGGVQGRNDWETCTAVLTLGTPWDHHLREADEDADAWRYAADRAMAELYQAVERVRSIRRADVPLWQGVIGQLPAANWTADGVEVVTLAEARRAEEVNEGLALLEQAVVRFQGTPYVAKLLGVSADNVYKWKKRGAVPDEHLEKLRATLTRSTR